VLRATGCAVIASNTRPVALYILHSGRTQIHSAHINDTNNNVVRIMSENVLPFRLIISDSLSMTYRKLRCLIM
jgi:hypothetical protein